MGPGSPDHPRVVHLARAADEPPFRLVRAVSTCARCGDILSGHAAGLGTEDATVRARAEHAEAVALHRGSWHDEDPLVETSAGLGAGCVDPASIAGIPLAGRARRVDPRIPRLWSTALSADGFGEVLVPLELAAVRGPDDPGLSNELRQLLGMPRTGDWGRGAVPAHLEFAVASQWGDDRAPALADEPTRYGRRYARFERRRFPAGPPGGEAARRSTRSFDPSQCLSLTDLGAVLGAVFPSHGGHAHGSAGALYAIEAFLVARRVQECDPSTLLHVLPSERALETLWTCPTFFSAAFPSETWIHDAALVIVLAATLVPYIERYGERGYRFVLLEAGAIAHELEARAGGRGLGTCVVGGFVDTAIASALDLDLARGEQPVVCLAVGGSSALGLGDVASGLAGRITSAPA